MAVDRDKLEDESPMLRFYRIVLGWDYFRLLKESCKNKGKEKAGDGDIGLKEVKDTYKDMDDYISTFEPLIFEEIKAQITQRTNEDEGIFLSSCFLWIYQSNGYLSNFFFLFFVGLVLNMTQKALNFSLSFLHGMVNKFVAFAFVW